MTPRDQLLASHEEFRKLAVEHTQYAQRLRLKDQMASIERTFRQQVQNQVA